MSRFGREVREGKTDGWMEGEGAGGVAGRTDARKGPRAAASGGASGGGGVKIGEGSGGAGRMEGGRRTGVCGGGLFQTTGR